MARTGTAAIITAGGAGRRFGGVIKKQFRSLCGKPLLLHSLEIFAANERIDEIVLVVPADTVTRAEREIVGKYNLDKVHKVVPGGRERQHSVKNGLDAVTGPAELVIIHDGVRPFVTHGVIEKVILEASVHGAAISALPANDTVKISDSEGFIEDTVPRESVWMAQTPQAFSHEVLKKAFEIAGTDGAIATDESLLVERSGVRVKLVPGRADNIKITTEEDFRLAELICRYRQDGCE